MAGARVGLGLGIAVMLTPINRYLDWRADQTALAAGRQERAVGVAESQRRRRVHVWRFALDHCRVGDADHRPEEIAELAADAVHLWSAHRR